MMKLKLSNSPSLQAMVLFATTLAPYLAQAQVAPFKKALIRPTNPSASNDCRRGMLTSVN
jgi:hypothetical protein